MKEPRAETLLGWLGVPSPVRPVCGHGGCRGMWATNAQQTVSVGGWVLMASLTSRSVYGSAIILNCTLV